jgi:hypothetical protein
MKQLLSLFIIAMTLGVNAQSELFPGYQKTLKGERLDYHAPQEDATEALVVRSEDSDHFIEWESALIPSDYSGEFINFQMMMAIDVNPEDPHSFTLYMNDKKLFDIESPVDTLKKHIQIAGTANSEFDFRATRVDKYGDLIGYLDIRIPTELVRKGEAARFKIAGEHAESRTWFILYAYTMSPSFTIQAENAIRKADTGNERVVKLEVVYYQDGVEADIQIGQHKEKVYLNYGYNCLYVSFPAEEQERELDYSLHIAGQLFDSGKVTLEPIQQMTIYLVHHSHVDIGYTHVQTEVEQKQWEYIEQCIALAENSLDYPKEAQFKWNIEVMWALDSYWKQAKGLKKEKLKQAIKKGWIELDALYGNMLTGLSSPEELMYLMKSAKDIAAECEVELQSAMISDVPGWTWGLVPALSQHGVKYLSLGTNTFHRIGSTIEEWGDRPFYWESASGEEKVLTWIHGKGYSSFHTGLGAVHLVNKLDEQILLSYMNELRDKEYPYNKVVLRYNIGSDNGPPDALLSEKVQNWNENYESPKLVISTISESFKIFEEEYGQNLPVVRGDFTGYWEDGAASSARETRLNRESAHHLTQAQTLMAMKGMKYPEAAFHDAWQNIMLYNEHTWGSWNSISEPHADFTKQQWAIKQAFAVDGNKQSKALVEEALLYNTEVGSQYYELVNTHSWSVRDLLTIPAVQAMDYNAVEDEQGNSIPCQKLKNGDLIFVSNYIPALSSVKYKLSKTRKLSKESMQVEGSTIENDYFKVTLDPQTGHVNQLIWKAKNIDLVSNGEFKALNEYIYVEGRHPDKRFKAGEAFLEIDEIGPVMLSLKASYSDIKGAHQLTSTYSLYADIERVDVENDLDKEEIYKQEGVHFAFPFHVPGGKSRYDLAYAVCEINKDQIKGSNKNFYTIENWVDISNEEYGVTWISKDAPLVEFSHLYNDPVATGYIKEVPETQTVISYVMNNYWETNYLAAQEGSVKFRYSLFPHQAYDPGFSEKRALELQEPILIQAVSENHEVISFNLKIDNENIIIQSIKLQEDGQYRVRVFNSGLNTEKFTLGGREFVVNSMQVFELIVNS